MGTTVPLAGTAAAPDDTDAVTSLAVGVDQVLSRLTDAVTVDIAGHLNQSLVGTKLVLRVKGPAGVSQIGQSSPELPEVDKSVVVLGTPPTTAATTGGVVAGTDQATTGEAAAPSGASTTTTVAVAGSVGEELAAGDLSVSLSLPAGRPDQPGAYLLVVEIKSGDEVIASGQRWIGKAAAREAPLDLAFVWPVSLGVHRDVDGVFYDTVFEDALDTTPVADSASDHGTLGGIAGLAERFPEWRFTLAIEPVLLAQLRDMADGYTRLDETGAKVEVTADYRPAQNAAASLDSFRDAVARDTVEVATGPYAGADLGMLASEGWRDGFEQIQLGKQELQQTLELGAPLAGACSPDLGLTSGSLSSYAGASIDHIVVDASLAAMLTEPVDEGTVAVRVRDEENDRATLILADTTLSSVLGSPSDPDLLFVVLAAELAEVPRDAFVIVPNSQFKLVPDAYLDNIGRTLAGLDWVQTQTLSELLRTYSPGTRPVMLRTPAASSPAYIEASLLEGLRSAHEAVADLGSIADATRAPLGAARRLLYTAESRWWWRDGISPAEATIGLQYARRAEELARAELAKVRYVGADSSLIAGHEGIVTLSLDNSAAYPVTAEVQLNGTGLVLPDGSTLEIELQPGRTALPVRVKATEGEHVLSARLVAGETLLDEISRSVRFVTVSTVLPAIIVGGAAVLVGLFFLARWVLRKRRPARDGVSRRRWFSRKRPAPARTE